MKTFASITRVPGNVTLNVKEQFSFFRKGNIQLWNQKRRYVNY